MREREQVVEEMLLAATPSEPDKYLLRLLKVSLLQAELLLDIRDLLCVMPAVRPKSTNLRHVIVDAPPRGKDKRT